MKKGFLILSILISQTFAFAQDSKVSKIAKYISKDKWKDARELLDELDNIPKYKTDIDYWFVRTCYYKAAVATHINSDKELYKIEKVEAKKSFEKLVEYDKTDASKSYSEYIPQFRKEIYNVQAQSNNHHTVIKGETIMSIAEKYEVSPFEIYKVNPELHNKSLEPKMVILLPITSILNKKNTEFSKNDNQTIESSTNTQSSSTSQANDNGKTVTLTQIGQGKTKDAAKYNALRNAIENAFGTFISSNTTIFKDELAKDEIVSLSSGNIQNFEILSETQMPDGSYTSVLKATVSIGKLATFCESKGIAVEFKGGLFAANIKLQELNKKNEEAIMKNLYIIANTIITKGLFDFSIKVEEPVQISGGSDVGKWDVKLNITSKPNKNLNSVIQILVSTLSNIALSETEIQDYKSKNIKVFIMSWDHEKFYFRSIVPIEVVMKIAGINIPRATSMFKLENGIATFNFPYNQKPHNSSNFENGGQAFKAKTRVVIGLATRLPSNEDDYKMLLEYDHVYNPYYYTQDQNYLKIDTSVLFRTITNEVHNALDISELNKISEYKVEPIR
ncbi:LysM peptidoglycan-binding domain-containing protein [Flavobacterium sp.]|jgi:hypothetical protein|uniref:LysM peptidoglycan-binding domain-containing protein n=1 Tax=Flavobacterium sp. TaxID=239 RepID=UPI0037BF28B4